jgi:ubiquinone/menaquinone biosynthesis C-methylase UbiE
MSINGEVPEGMCDPRTGASLRRLSKDGCEYLWPDGGEHGYPIRDGIPIFTTKEALQGSNRKYQQFYDKIALFYDLYITATASLVRKKGWRAARAELSQQAGPIGINDRVLEVGIGTGLNLLILPRDMPYYGIDISWNMLCRCRRRARRIGREVCLSLAEAEALPFADESFDVAFTVGGFNFFRDKQAAIDELIRVARPGARILIVDETEEHVRKSYERTPLARGTFKSEDREALRAPVELVPRRTKDIKCEEVWNGRFYSLSFVKP